MPGRAARCRDLVPKRVIWGKGGGHFLIPLTSYVFTVYPSNSWSQESTASVKVRSTFKEMSHSKPNIK